MVAQPNRRFVDGENEYVTITRIEPRVYIKGHMSADTWVGHAMLDDKPILMGIRNTKEDRGLFLAAGYIPQQIFTNDPVDVQITVLTAWDEIRGWYAGEVRSAAETVHTEAERRAAWAADMAKYGGKFDRVGLTELRFARLGESVAWSKNERGEYVRTEGVSVKVYENAVHPDIARLAAAFAVAGIQPAKPLTIVTSGAFKRTRTAAVSIAVHMPRGTGLPANVKAMIEEGAYCNGDWFVVQLKRSA